MNLHSATRAPRCLLAVVLVASAACGRAPDTSSPVLERTSTSFLESELSGALEDLTAARETARSDPEAAVERLSRAEETLRRMRDAYLPLFQAKGHADNAYRLHAAGRDGDAVEELERIREAVLEVSEIAGAPLVGELERIEALVSDARIELEARSPSTDATLQELRIEMEDFVTRAGLFLGASG